MTPSMARDTLSAAKRMRGVLVDDTLRDLRDLGLALEVEDVAEYGPGTRSRAR